MSWSFLLQILALIAAGLATYGVPVGRWNMIGATLFFLILSLMVSGSVPLHHAG